MEVRIKTIKQKGFKIMNKKAILAIGIIALFAGMTISPVTADSTQTTQVKVLANNGLLSTEELAFSAEELEVLDAVLEELSEKMQTAESYDQVVDILNEFIRGYGRYPTIIALMKLFIKTVTLNTNIYQLTPFRHRAFIMSWGFSNKMNPLKENKLNLFRPLTCWHYTGRSEYILNSRTVIIDPYPFNVRMMDGRQIGIMRNFVGVYLYRRTLGDKDMTLFFGRAAGIVGMDLSVSFDGAW